MPVTVLLADDSTTIRRYARSILEEGDDECRVIECGHGGQAPSGYLPRSMKNSLI